MKRYIVTPVMTTKRTPLVNLIDNPNNRYKVNQNEQVTLREHIHSQLKLERKGTKYIYNGYGQLKHIFNAKGDDVLPRILEQLAESEEDIR